MIEKVFRTYDIRGIYSIEIGEEFALKIGKAFATFNPGRTVVGGDCRLSTPSLKHALIEGLTSAGADVIDIGTVPTSLVIFTVAYKGYEGGVQVSASHNPKEYAGFLFYGKEGRMMGMGSGLEVIKELFEKEKFRSGSGNIEKYDIIPEYEKFVLQRVDIQRKLKVVIDAGNGVAGLLVPRLLRKVGMEVVELFCEPDGNFPNREPEPTPDNLRELQRKVIECKADVGLAYDGDCDRLVAVDEKGYVLKPAELFGIFIKSYLEQKKGRVVYDALSSEAVRELIEVYGGIPIACRVGHVFIHSTLLAEGALLAGETSGHYFFKEVFGIDDAAFASLKLLEYLSKVRRPMSKCYQKIPYCYETLRIPTTEERKFEFMEKLKQFLGKRYELDCLDGVKVKLKGGWALFRPSHTEPKISIAFEAKDPQNFKQIKVWVKRVVRRFLC